MTLTPKPYILLVEDEKDLADLVVEELEAAGMQVHVFNQGGNVVKYLQRHFVNLVLLDVGLPDMSGFDIIRGIRAAGIDYPVIFLTACGTEVDKVEGLENGADDYVTKPFQARELVARIHAVLRRTETAGDTKLTRNTTLKESPFQFCGAEVNPTRLEMTFPSGNIVKIGRKELGVMAFMSENPYAVQSRRSLIHAVWGVHADVRSRSLDQYVVKIRELLVREGCDSDTFRTIHGVGYIYDPEPVVEAD